MYNCSVNPLLVHIVPVSGETCRGDGCFYFVSWVNEHCHSSYNLQIFGCHDFASALGTWSYNDQFSWCNHSQCKFL